MPSSRVRTREDSDNLNNENNPPRKKSKVNIQETCSEDENDRLREAESNMADESGEDEHHYQSKPTSDSGVILRIEVKNFMCHRHLRVDFCRNINFVNGSNGSGKSAILAALQICLGARARLTHRASKLDDLIRHGWDSHATIAVKLLNGIDGYRHDVYGNSITIRRIIKRGTNSVTEIVSDNGTIISKERRELDRILDHLNISVDNPCVVLDQENSKKFLKGNDAEKYNFFLKATDLLRIKDTIQEIQQQIESYRVQCNAAMRILPQLLKKVEENTALLNQFNQIDVLQNKVETLRELLLWCDYTEQLKKKEEAVKDLMRRKEAFDQKKLKLEKIKELLCSREEERNEMGSREEEYTSQLEKAREALAIAKENLIAGNGPLAALTAEENSIRQQLAKYEQDRTDLQKEIKAERDRLLSTAEGEEEKQIIREAEDIDMKLQEIDDKVHELHDSRHGYEERVQRAKDAFRSAEIAYKGAKINVSREESFMRELEKQGQDPMLAFGAGIVNIVLAIRNNASKFSSLPVGPLGAHIKMKEECSMYRGCVEEHLRNELRNFIVYSQADKNTLQRLIRSLRLNPREIPAITIAPTSVTRHNTPVYPLVLQISEAISIENIQVFNALVDLCRIESVLLAKDKVDANRYLEGSPGNHYLVHGASNVFYPEDGGKLVSRLYTRNGSTADQLNMGKGRRPVLGVDLEQQRQAGIDRLEEANQEYSNAKHYLNELQEEYKNAQIEYDSMFQQQQVCDEKRSRLLRRREQLRRRLEEIESAQNSNIDINDLEEERDALSSEIDNFSARLVLIGQQREHLKVKQIPLKEACISAQTMFNEANAKFDHYAILCEDAERKSNSARQRKVEIEQELAMSTATIQEAETNVKDLQQVVDTIFQRVGEAVRASRPDWDGQPVRVSLTMEQVQNKLTTAVRHVERELEQRKMLKISQDDAQKRLANSKREYMEKQSAIQAAEEKQKTLEKHIKERVVLWNAFQKYIQRQATKCFNDCLTKRGSSGCLLFDRTNKTLSLKVQQTGDEASQSENISNMSGGERSYATLALLLALGSCSDSPFRVMDEFDVFMDSISRQTALKELIKHARLDINKSRQFIFITPQDLKGIQVCPDLMIFKLQTPREGQSTIPDEFVIG